MGSFTMLPVTFVSMTLIASSLQLGAVPLMGPVGIVDFTRMENCKESPPDSKLAMAMNGGKKVWNADVNLKQDIDASTTFLLVADQWTGTEYRKNTFKYSGELCKYLNQYLPKIRKDAYASVGITDNCVIKAGKYIAKNLSGKEADIKMKAVPYGKFKAKLSVFNKKKEVVFCLILDIESKQK